MKSRAYDIAIIGGGIVGAAYIHGGTRVPIVAVATPLKDFKHMLE